MTEDQQEQYILCARACLCVRFAAKLWKMFYLSCASMGYFKTF